MDQIRQQLRAPAPTIRTEQVLERYYGQFVEWGTLLTRGDEVKAQDLVHDFNWASFEYSGILVPGIGLDENEIGISPLGAFRVRTAAKRWREGLAPFILVSGEHVHPNRTPYAEAIEMKRLLMARYQVPANAIVVDPYARHTTTNLRNAVRLLFRIGAPMDKQILLMKLDGLPEYIFTKDFSQRCTQELGYQPMIDIRDVSTFEISGLPNIVSLHADPQDPLDP